MVKGGVVAIMGFRKDKDLSGPIILMNHDQVMAFQSGGERHRRNFLLLARLEPSRRHN